MKIFLRHQVLFDGFLALLEAPVQAFEWLFRVETPNIKRNEDILRNKSHAYYDMHRARVTLH